MEESWFLQKTKEKEGKTGFLGTFELKAALPVKSFIS